MFRALALAVAAGALLVPPCLERVGAAREIDAGTALRLELAELVEHAELVLEGRIVTRSAQLTPTGRVATDHGVEVLRTFLGEPLAQRTLRLPGGVLPDGSGVLIPGMPRLALGEDVILFLTGEGAQGARMPVGLAQGKLAVVTSLAGEKVLVRRHDGLDWAHAPGEPVHHAHSGEHLDYAATVAEIHAAVQRRAQGGR